MQRHLRLRLAVLVLAPLQLTALTFGEQGADLGRFEQAWQAQVVGLVL